MKFYFSLPLVFAVLTAAGGCRMCSSPYDYCISAYVDRNGDYRGCDPFYRSGSVLFGNNRQSCEYLTADFTNAENYGITTPVSVGHGDRLPSSPTEIPKHTLPGTPIGIPPQQPQQPIKPDIPVITPGETIPNLNQLINSPRQETTPMPVIPPAKPNGKVPATEPDTMPFMPNDGDLVPPAVPQLPVTPPLPVSSPESFSIENLRLLEPTADKIEIISIEDAAADTVVR
ncbi:MAG: hypothetical protein LBH00_12195 [Planctomycetaceae bacterium]|nr:hypothetical protein [Planctomycetaceae bacterium]